MATSERVAFADVRSCRLTTLAQHARHGIETLGKYRGGTPDCAALVVAIVQYPFTSIQQSSVQQQESRSGVVVRLLYCRSAHR